MPTASVANLLPPHFEDLIMAALWNRADHYIFIMRFLLSFFFFFFFLFLLA